MTVKKKSTGELEEVGWGWSTKTFRIAILVAVLSMHPLGRSVLKLVGFQIPEEKAQLETKDEVGQVKDEVAQLKDDFKELKAEVKETNRNVDALAKSFGGFQVDFEKYRKTLPE